MRSFECPKCGTDISESYQADEPDVGLVGGWYCDNCNEGFADKGDEYLEDAVFPQPAAQQKHGCPQHPEAIPEMGYGLAGGGIGPYSYCPICGKIIAKSQDIGA